MCVCVFLLTAILKSSADRWGFWNDFLLCLPFVKLDALSASKNLSTIDANLGVLWHRQVEVV